MNRAERINLEMEARGWTVRDLSKHSGVAYTTIRSMLERDLVNASIDNTSKLCKALGIRLDDLVRDVSKAPLISKGEDSTVRESEYPYISSPISAGCPESVDAVIEEKSINLPDSLMGKYAGSRSLRVMRVNGESMNRLIPHGSLIAVKGVDLANLKNGDVVVYADDHAYSVKRFYRLDGDKLIFRPDSHDERFTEYVTTADELVEIVGKVVVYVVEMD